MKNPRNYPWPASALDADDLSALFHARESADVRVPINRLIALAVRRAYAAHYAGPTTERGPHLVVLPANPSNEQRKEAA